ncbi:hypothetical protein [Bacillus sp. JCM 19041]|uniref:hypothetical protein n=1 Tax=Bacillus sp. JCM 19041 TaxID=1460637 RepID=UPI0006D02E45
MPIYSKSIRTGKRAASYQMMYKERHYYSGVAITLFSLAIIQVILGFICAFMVAQLNETGYSWYYFILTLNGSFVIGGILWGIAEIVENTIPDWKRKQLYEVSKKKSVEQARILENDESNDK